MVTLAAVFSFIAVWVGIVVLYALAELFSRIDRLENILQARRLMNHGDYMSVE